MDVPGQSIVPQVRQTMMLYVAVLLVTTTTTVLAQGGGGGGGRPGGGGGRPGGGGLSPDSFKWNTWGGNSLCVSPGDPDHYGEELNSSTHPRRWFVSVPKSPDKSTRSAKRAPPWWWLRRWRWARLDRVERRSMKPNRLRQSVSAPSPPKPHWYRHTHSQSDGASKKIDRLLRTYSARLIRVDGSVLQVRSRPAAGWLGCALR